MKYPMLFVLMLTGCASATKPIPSVTITGKVEKVCVECSEAVLVGGGGLVWDVLSFRITEPTAYAGFVISVEVLVKDVGQRAAYAEGATLSLAAAPAALKEHRIMTNASALHGFE